MIKGQSPSCQHCLFVRLSVPRISIFLSLSHTNIGKNRQTIQTHTHAQTISTKFSSDYIHDVYLQIVLPWVLADDHTGIHLNAGVNKQSSSANNTRWSAISALAVFWYADMQTRDVPSSVFMTSREDTVTQACSPTYICFPLSLSSFYQHKVVHAHWFLRCAWFLCGNTIRKTFAGEVYIAEEAYIARDVYNICRRTRTLTWLFNARMITWLFPARMCLQAGRNSWFHDASKHKRVITAELA
jgi:hypothetical protein